MGREKRYGQIVTEVPIALAMLGLIEPRVERPGKAATRAERPKKAATRVGRSGKQ